MNLSLKAILVSLFAALGAIVVGQGLFAALSIKGIERSVDTIASSTLPSLSAAGKMNAASATIRVAQYRVLTAPDPEARAKSVELLNLRRQSMAAARAEYEPLIASAEERALYNEFGQAQDKLREIYDTRVVPLIKAGENALATDIFRDETVESYNTALALSAKIVDMNQKAGAIAGADAKSDIATVLTWTYVALGIAVVVALAAAVFSLLRVSKPITQITGSMTALAAGDTAAAIPYAGRADEIGAMAAAVQVFKDNMIRGQALEAESEHARASAEVQRKRVMVELADSFERAVGGIVDTVSSAATELNATAGAMTASAGETASQATVVASAAEEAAVNVAAVASATEQMGASVNEIGRQVQHSARMCEGAVVEARDSAVLINELSQAATRIGDVVRLISDIAGQTNLLALNATIEAARAGEAGRGFAVVATEVKELASQTAKATADISSQIEAIQSSTGRAVTAVGHIGETIAGLNATAGAISSAVSEQTAATQEIVHNVSQVAMGTGNVTSTITGVARAAGETGAAASQVLVASGELSQQSEKLRLEMGRFLDTVRAA